MSVGSSDWLRFLNVHVTLVLVSLLQSKSRNYALKQKIRGVTRTALQNCFCIFLPYFCQIWHTDLRRWVRVLSVKLRQNVPNYMTYPTIPWGMWPLSEFRDLLDRWFSHFGDLTFTIGSCFYFNHNALQITNSLCYRKQHIWKIADLHQEDTTTVLNQCAKVIRHNSQHKAEYLFSFITPLLCDICYFLQIVITSEHFAHGNRWRQVWKLGIPCKIPSQRGCDVISIFEK